MNTCYIPQIGVDDVIATNLGWKASQKEGQFNPMIIATLRGMYDDAHPNAPLNLENLAEATETLVKYRRQLSQVSAKSINSAGSNLANRYRLLKRALTAEERHNRVNMVASLFSTVIDDIQKANPTLSRKTIINGFTTNGNKILGEFAIFDKVYNYLMTRQSMHMHRGTEEDINKAHAYRNVLANWSTIVPFVRMKLRDTEGIKIGNVLEYCATANPDNYDGNKLSELYDASEAKREAWQETNDAQSAFGSIGLEVRRFLGNIPEYIIFTDAENQTVKPEVKRDDLGFPIMLDPMKIHQSLMDELRGVTSETEMMNALNRLKAYQIWMIPIHDQLLKNPRLRTQFFCDFKKNFQIYSMLNEEINYKDETKSYKVSILNKIDDVLSSVFNTRILRKKPMYPGKSMYDKEGKVIIDRYNEFKNKVNSWLADSKEEKSPLLNQPFQKFYAAHPQQQKALIKDLCELLDIDIDADTIFKIYGYHGKTKDMRTILKALKDIGTIGMPEAETAEALEKFVNKRSFKALIDRKVGANAKVGAIREKLNSIFKVISKNRDLLKLESRASYTDKKGRTVSYFSSVNPSFLGDRIDKIQSYVKADDKEGLKKYLNQQYFQSSYFKHDGKILNKWLEELVQCCNGKTPLAETVAGQLSFRRMLGAPKNEFENFTSRDHALSMFADFNDRVAGTAVYPVFILGDSGVNKGIRFKIYGINEILDGLYNVYIQEKRRMQLAKATNELLEKKGYSKILNFSDSENSYSLLPFLNEDKYRIPEGASEEVVKRVLETYMNDAQETFKKRLADFEVLKTKKSRKGDKEVDVYTYMNSFATPENIDAKIKEFFWNTKFATIQQLQLMTIDTSFYENTKNLQKRYKEIHAPGTLLSTEAIDTYSSIPNKKYSEDGKERCIYIKDIKVNAEEFNNDFMEAIKIQFKDRPDIIEKYKKNSLTDGQGWRTLDSYRKVKGMAGQWTQEMEDAYRAIKDLRKKYGENSEIPGEELSRIASLSVVFQPIKPYMFTHEYLSLSENDGMYIPVQHKYAEAVIIPELLPKGSLLKDMAYHMENNDIDLICSETAVKVGCFGVADIKDIKDSNSLSAALNSAKIHSLNYSDYRIQTNVPEHTYSSQLFGTQPRKLVMAGVKLNDDRYSSYVDDNKVHLGKKYGSVKLNGRNLITFYNSLIIANILDSFKKFDSNVSDINKLSEMLIQTTINNSRESMDNLLAYALEESERGISNFSIPLFEGSLEHDSAALLFSMFKKIVNKQSIKGGSAVQVSALGIKGYEKDGGLQYITDDNNNILYAQVELPWDISYTDAEGNEVALDFNDYCNPDGTLKMKSDGKTSLLEEVLPGALDFVAYRIPTERDYSMINCKIVRFSQKTAGGTIKVPPQGTTIAGFDFDIDKLYFMRNEYKVDKKAPLKEANAELAGLQLPSLSLETYDYTKSPLENSRAARNNMLIHLIRQRLMDPETFEKRYTPGGFFNASKAARVMRELFFGNLDDAIINTGSGYVVDFNKLNERVNDVASDPEPNYDPSDPMTIIIYNQQNQIAGKLIGIFANQNTNHAFSTLLHTFKLTNAIAFAGHSYDDLLSNPNGIDTSLNVAELLAASVDAVKDPVLNFLNLNTLTADAGALLARLGYTMEEIGLLFNQPVVKEVCDYCFNNDVSMDIAILEVTKNLDKKGTLVPISDFSKNTLALNIINDRKMREKGHSSALYLNSKFDSGQLAILKLFSDILQSASDVSSFVTSTKFTASNAVGSTFGDFYAQQMKVRTYLNKYRRSDSKLNVVMKVTEDIAQPITDDRTLLLLEDEEYLESLLQNPLAYEQAMFDMNRRAVIKLTKYFPYETSAYKDSREDLALLTEYGTLDADTINSIHRDVLVYMLTQQENSDFNGDLIMPNTNYTVREYYTKHFTNWLDGFLNSEEGKGLKELSIFKHLYFTSIDTDSLDLRIMGVGGLASYKKEELKESWARLYQDYPALARDLFLYNFYKTGFTFSHASFMHLAPNDLKQSIRVGNMSYVEFLQKVQKGEFKISSQKFAKQYIRNHLDNRRFVYRVVNDSAKKIIEPLIKPAGANVYFKSFELDASTSKDVLDMFVLRTENSRGVKTMFFRPVIEYKGMYYMAKSTNSSSFNASTDGKITYEKVTSLGTKGRSLQYLNDESTALPNSIKIDNTGGEHTDSLDKEITTETKEFSFDEMVDYVAQEYYRMASSLQNSNLGRDEQGELIGVEVYKEAFSDKLRGKDAELKELMDKVKQSCKKYGVLTLDEDGKSIKVC